jgi:hypothetical protein
MSFHRTEKRATALTGSRSIAEKILAADLRFPYALDPGAMNIG